jgi:ribosome-interacting GTPase 1
MAKKITLKEIGDMLTHVVKHMATKDNITNVQADIARVQDQVNSIEAELKYGRYETRLGKLEDKVFGAPQR